MSCRQSKKQCCFVLATQLQSTMHKLFYCFLCSEVYWMFFTKKKQSSTSFLFVWLVSLPWRKKELAEWENHELSTVKETVLLCFSKTVAKYNAQAFWLLSAFEDTQSLLDVFYQQKAVVYIVFVCLASKFVLKKKRIDRIRKPWAVDGQRNSAALF